MTWLQVPELTRCPGHSLNLTLQIQRDVYGLLYRHKTNALPPPSPAQLPGAPSTLPHPQKERPRPAPVQSDRLPQGPTAEGSGSSQGPQPAERWAPPGNPPLPVPLRGPYSNRHRVEAPAPKTPHHPGAEQTPPAAARSLTSAKECGTGPVTSRRHRASMATATRRPLL